MFLKAILDLRRTVGFVRLNLLTLFPPSILRRTADFHYPTQHAHRITNALDLDKLIDFYGLLEKMRAAFFKISHSISNSMIRFRISNFSRSVSPFF